MPDMAAQGRRLIYVHGVGLGYLATIRKDGGPRLHPMCPLIVDGGLWTLIGPHGPKCADLRRDGRYAMHALSPKDVDDEFVVMGRAIETADPDEVGGGGRGRQLAGRPERGAVRARHRPGDAGAVHASRPVAAGLHDLARLSLADRTVPAAVQRAVRSARRRRADRRGRGARVGRRVRVGSRAVPPARRRGRRSLDRHGRSGGRHRSGAHRSHGHARAAAPAAGARTRDRHARPPEQRPADLRRRHRR